ncbi:MAG: DUF2203 domain-containing protein, partial [Planctomycetota bacterium]
MSDCEADRSRAVTVESKHRRFTVAEADRTLPLVSRIVSDIVDNYAHLQHLQAQRKAASKRTDRAAADELGEQGSRAVERLNDLIGELADVGCRLKDLQAGLVDFPARRNSRDIMLCWKLGEPRLAYWHDMDAGFASRRP